MNWHNYIILVAGGYLQEPMCMEIKSRGHDLLLIDGNPDCYCRQYADEFECIDTYNVGSCVDFVYNLDYKPLAILTDAADIGITIAAMCNAVGLPSTPLTQALLINDKISLRGLLGTEHAPVWLDASGMHYLEAWIAWENICNEFDIDPLPCIFKPRANCASRGIHKIETKYDFGLYFNAVDMTQKYNLTGVLIEQCLTGTEVATDWWLQDSVPLYVNGAQRIFSAEFGLEEGHINPFFPVPDEMRVLATGLCRVGMYSNGPLKVDFIHDPEFGWCILEAATRWSGGYDHGFTAKISTGRNLEKPLLDFALGLPVDIIELQATAIQHYAAAIGIYNHAKHGTMTKLQNVSGIVKVIETGSHGTGCAGRNLWLLTSGETGVKAWEVAETAKQILKH